MTILDGLATINRKSIWSQMNEALLAVDVARAYANLGVRARSTALIRPVTLDDLPVSTIHILPHRRTQAILSWRWDVDSQLRASRNISAALAHAFNVGIEYLFTDFVSVDQSLAGRALIRAVADFTSLFGELRVIAAYDTS